MSADRPAMRPHHLAMTEATCTCPGGPAYEGPQPYCDVHGQPSVAYEVGLAEGQRKLIDDDEALREEGRAGVLAKVEALCVEFERWERMNRNAYREGDPDMHAEEYHLGRADEMVDVLAKLRTLLVDNGAALREHDARVWDECDVAFQDWLAPKYTPDFQVRWPANPYRDTTEGPHTHGGTDAPECTTCEDQR